MVSDASYQQLAGNEAFCLLGLRIAENNAGWPAFYQGAPMQQHNVAGEPRGLAQIVGGHHDLHPARAHGVHQS